jgi:hypothetical protein
MVINMFEKGQMVYTKREVMGWFDRSLERRIPINATCTIEAVYEHESVPKERWTYGVAFTGKYSEFGKTVLFLDDLKMDNG